MVLDLDLIAVHEREPATRCAVAEEPDSKRRDATAR